MRYTKQTVSNLFFSVIGWSAFSHRGLYFITRESHSCQFPTSIVIQEIMYKKYYLISLKNFF